MGDYADALREVETAAKLSDHSAHYDYYSLVLGYWGTGDTTKALENYQLAAERDPRLGEYKTLPRTHAGVDSLGAACHARNLCAVEQGLASVNGAPTRLFPMFDVTIPFRYSSAMKSLLPCAALLLLTILPASARVGETLDECVQRYGPMIERRPARLAGSDAEVMVFSKAGITVVAEFREGKAWHLTYRKLGLNTVEVDAIIMANSGDSLWGSPLKTRDKEYRITDDKSRVALINWDRKGMAGSLTIMSREYARMNYSEAAKRAESSAVPTATGSQRTNPLPGF